MANNEEFNIVPISAGIRLAKLAIEAPEAVYDAIVKAEKYLKEMKETARATIINRMKPEQKVLEIETDSYTVNCTRKHGNIQPNIIREVVAAAGVDPAIVVYKLPVEYGALPNARTTLESMLREKVISQEQFNSCFKPDGHVVTVKPKSAKTITLNLNEEG